MKESWCLICPNSVGIKFQLWAAQNAKLFFPKPVVTSGKWSQFDGADLVPCMVVLGHYWPEKGGKVVRTVP